MKRMSRKLSVAAIAGAASLLVSQSYGAITITATNMGNQTFGNGTYDVIDFNLTSLGSGIESQPGLSTGNTADPGVNFLVGTFSPTGTGDYIAIPGTNSGSYAYTKYIFSGGSTPPGTYGASYVNLDSTPVAPSRTLSGTATGSNTAITGQGTALYANWSTTDDPIEPANSTGTQSGPNPLVAQILVTPGGGVSFTGSFTPDSSPVLEPISFSFTPTSTVSAGPTHSIISLTAGTTAPTGYGSADGSIAMTGGHGSYNVSTASGFTSATTGYVSVTGFTAGDQEIYALKLSNGSAGAISPTGQTTLLTSIVNDINGVGNSNIASTGVTASLVTGVFSTLFPGYDVLLASTGTTGSAAELGFDFSSSGEGNSADSAVFVTGVAAVPEPATAAGIVLGAAGLLLGRRRKQASVAV